MNQLTTQQERMPMDSVGIKTGSTGSKIAPQNLAEVVKFAEVMCRADIALPKHLRGNAGACMAVAMQALEWELSPFAVASKSYAVNGAIAYEAQLIAAVVNTRSGIKGRLRYHFEGEGNSLTCTVTGVLDGEECSYTSPPIGSITTKNSPLWKSDPQQQLGYFSARSWARRHCPEVILGVYDRDEAEEFRGPDNAKNITPAFDPFADEPVAARSEPAGALSTAAAAYVHPAGKPAPAFDYAELNTAAPPRGGDDEQPLSSSQTVDEPNPNSSTVDLSPADPAIGSREAEGAGSESGDDPAPSDLEKDRAWLFNVGVMLWGATNYNGDEDVLKNQRAAAAEAYPATGVSEPFLKKATSVFKNCMSVVQGSLDPDDGLKMVAGIIGCEEKVLQAKAKGGKA